jgi:hypothetical protein
MPSGVVDAAAVINGVPYGALLRGCLAHLGANAYTPSGMSRNAQGSMGPSMKIYQRGWGTWGTLGNITWWMALNRP